MIPSAFAVDRARSPFVYLDIVLISIYAARLKGTSVSKCSNYMGDSILWYNEKAAKMSRTGQAPNN